MKKAFTIFIIFVLSINLLKFVLINHDNIKIFFDPEKGSFEDIILGKYRQQSFHRLEITKYYKNDKLNIINDSAKTDNDELVDTIINYFKHLELKQIGNPKSEYDKYFSDAISFRLYNKETYEAVNIWVMSDSIIQIYFTIMVKEINESTNGIRWYPEHKSVRYEIKNSKLDLNTLNQIFSKLYENSEKE